ncbi:PIN domain nuclease, a component of toxin-antitoxin system (PIN domain) [Microlunatus sagamiharensis]|uniref:PIN domain nuclease, a component of toxin-antitoxin system (PIN domain) n=1 Tax=Microlunatus sagamiharensis TaxID=546874 RepID=A0A1H2N1G8_9ACTN|nr:type II toxin-antitoxin system VapC family toxin [Microlunatus sagamiharensis]SDU99174.1 PIN domain nuclease, a component of toxin-antitoxin system (PIN domain) [Microlunatus sagamiharensis]
MSERYLLDTHVLLWLLGAPDRVRDDIRAELADRTNDLVVSAATAIEISTKVRLGKLDAPTLPATLTRRIGDLGATPLPITIEHGLLAGTLRWEHRDPFDRLLVAQATLEELVLVTVDRAILGLPALRTLSW